MPTTELRHLTVDTEHFSILDKPREVARPQVDRFQGFPEALRSTICLLLSINTVPRGCEDYALVALLEIDRMQAEMTQAL